MLSSVIHTSMLTVISRLLPAGDSYSFDNQLSDIKSSQIYETFSIFLNERLGTAIQEQGHRKYGLPIHLDILTEEIQTHIIITFFFLLGRCRSLLRRSRRIRYLRCSSRKRRRICKIRFNLYKSAYPAAKQKT
jgi:hypothetical protein